MFIKFNFPGRISVLPVLMAALLLTGCSVKNKLVTDTGSGKSQSVSKEDYLVTNGEDINTGNAKDNQYKVLTLTKGTFEEGALRQTLQLNYNNLPTVRLKSDGNEMQFGTYIAQYMDYVEAGDVIATCYMEADEIAIEQARITLTRLQERYEKAKADIQIELEELEEKRKIIYNGYENQIAGIEYKQRQQDWENESYHYEQNIADAEKKLAELVKTSKEYEIKTDVAGYVVYSQIYKEGALLSDGAYICSILDGNDVFAIAEMQADQFTYGKEAEFEAQGGVAAGSIVSGGKLALYGNLDTDKVVFKITLDDGVSQLKQNNWMVMNANLKTIRNVILIPREAVTVEDEEYYVTVMQEDGSLLQTEFIPGGSNANEYWVLRGLSEGMEIVYR